MKPLPFIVTLLGALAIFPPIAFGQTVTCNATTVPSQPRAEGLTELTGDILLTCTGGRTTTAGMDIPQTSIIVYLNTQVTNRQFGTWSDAYLLVNEPGSGQANAVATQTMCANSNGICPIAATGLGGGMSGGDYSGTSDRPNMFMGYSSGNSVTFPSVPIDAPGSGQNLYLRITGIRVNVSAISGGQSGNLISDVAISGSVAIQVNNSALTTGDIASGNAAETLLRSIVFPGQLGRTAGRGEMTPTCG